MNEIAYFEDIALSILQRAIVKEVFEDHYAPVETASKIIKELSHHRTFDESFSDILSDFIIKYYCRYYFIVNDMVEKYTGPVTLYVTWYDNKEFLKKIKEKLENIRL